MATVTNRSLARPAKDEWGVYDPQQAGLAALFARLDTAAKTTTPPAPAVRQTIEQPDAAPGRPALRDAK